MPRPPSKMTNRSKNMLYSRKSAKMPIFRCTELRNYWADFQKLNVFTEAITWTVSSKLFQIDTMTHSRVTASLPAPTLAPWKNTPVWSKSHFWWYISLVNYVFHHVGLIWKHTWPSNKHFDRLQHVFRLSSQHSKNLYFLRFFDSFFSVFVFSDSDCQS